MGHPVPFMVLDCETLLLAWTSEDWGCYSYVYLWVMLFPFGESYDLKKKKVMFLDHRGKSLYILKGSWYHLIIVDIKACL